MMLLIKAIEHFVSKKLSFVSYRLPQTKKVKLLIGGSFTKDLPTGTTDYFMVSPFVRDAAFPQLYYVGGHHFNSKSDQLEEVISSDYPFFKSNFLKPVVSSKTDYLQQAQQVIDSLKKGDLQKLVLSRVVGKPLLSNQQAIVYQSLCNKYPEAFVYFLSFGDGIAWIGATPETLLKVTGTSAITVALAATQCNTQLPLSEVVWGEKEREEQAMVTTFIEGVLQQSDGISYTLEGPLTAQAGPLLHLKTKFSIQAFEGFSWLELTKKLHPTPAVCGLPRQAALEKLLSVEPHQRYLYAGFLGPVTRDSELQLFVNLRCMMLLGDEAFLFVGGGLTALSDAEAEWEETESKAETLLSVFPNNSPTLQDDAR